MVGVEYIAEQNR